MNKQAICVRTMKKSHSSAIGQVVPRRLRGSMTANDTRRCIRIIALSLVKGAQNSLQGWMR